MRRIKTSISDDQNYDSFLDIVANLVGILVILIMVIGVRARQAASFVVPTVPVTPVEVTIVEPPMPAPTPVPTGPSPEEIAQQTEHERQSAERLHADIHQVAGRIEEMETLSDQKADERNQLQLLVSMAEKSLGKRESLLKERDQVQLALATEIESEKSELELLKNQLASVELDVEGPEVIKHRPTPIAKTVFGKEEHFRLQGGRLAYVPVTGMSAQLKMDAENKLWKLGDNDEVTELLGPSRGFMMKYTLRRIRRRFDTPEGPRMGSMIELKRFVMVPQDPNIGEPVQTALNEGSEFARELGRMRPDETTITVWTYPDSYGEFRSVQEAITKRGFLVAARPLPNGYPIGGSPNGSKSVAE